MIDIKVVFASMYAKNVPFLGRKMQQYNDSQIAEAIQTLERFQNKLIDKSIEDCLRELQPNAKSDLIIK